MPAFALLAAWVIVGWCGTVPRPRWPHPPGPPDPDPWGPYLIGGIVAAVGGVVGGWVFGQLLAIDQLSAAGIVVTLMGAFAGGRLAGDIVGLAMGRAR
jgi:hypothetical protein